MMKKAKTTAVDYAAAPDDLILTRAQATAALRALSPLKWGDYALQRLATVPEGDGPRFVRFRNRACYRLGDIRAWLERMVPQGPVPS
jgi:hypothetical protein